MEALKAIELLLYAAVFVPAIVGALKLILK